MEQINEPKWDAWKVLPEAVRTGQVAFALAHDGLDMHEVMHTSPFPSHESVCIPSHFPACSPSSACLLSCMGVPWPPLGTRMNWHADSHVRGRAAV